MATVTPTVDRSVRGLITYAYTFGTGASAVGAPMDPGISTYSDKTITIEGTFGGATITLQGSNSAPSASQWHNLNDSRGQGNAIQLSAKAIRAVLENPKFMRPVIGATVSGVTDIDVTIHANKAARR
ncbi:hypothetical protein LCGC14_1810310 [marine sediment metagenome]|uniref:Uncharacterized protein n=1 Tax=marine sediment metagenome TaxID=412755 RepID=A0A0F9HA09_9ZZZZ